MNTQNIRAALASIAHAVIDCRFGQTKPAAALDTVLDEATSIGDELDSLESRASVPAAAQGHSGGQVSAAIPHQAVKNLIEASRMALRVSKKEDRNLSKAERNSLRQAIKAVKAAYPEGSFPASDVDGAEIAA